MNGNNIATKQDIEILVSKMERIEKLLEGKSTIETNKPYLSGKEVKEILGISEGTLKSYRAKGILKGKKLEGKYYYLYEDVMGIINHKGRN